jgi:hypothetical protein
MARMIGRWLTGGCGCGRRLKFRQPLGPDCAGHGSDPRRFKRREQREVREAVERFRGILNGLEPQEDGPEAMEGLVQEIEDWAPLRAKATRLLLGEDGPAS